MANPICVLRFLQRLPSIQPHPSEVFSRFFHPSLQVLSSEPPCRTSSRTSWNCTDQGGQFYPPKNPLVPEICLQVSWWTKSIFIRASVLEVLILTNLPWLKVDEVIVNNNCIHSMHVFHRSKASTKLRGKIALGGFPELPIEAHDYWVDKIHAPPPQFFAAKALFHTLLELLQHIEVPSIHISLFFCQKWTSPKISMLGSTSFPPIPPIPTFSLLRQF